MIMDPYPTEKFNQWNREKGHGKKKGEKDA